MRRILFSSLGTVKFFVHDSGQFSTTVRKPDKYLIVEV